jgi:hypothetical protein
MRAIVMTLLLAACSGGAANGSNQAANGGLPSAPPREAAGPCVGPIMPDMLAQCDFGPSERLSGVWVTGFERSEFVPGGTGARASDVPEPQRAWLAFAPGVYPDPAVRAELDQMRRTGAVEILFEGRRARPPGMVVVVDRIVSMRILGPAQD